MTIMTKKVHSLNPSSSISDAAKVFDSNKVHHIPVTIDDELIEVNANISSLGGYSAHADEQGLVEFIASMSSPPKHIRIIHGEANAQRALGRRIRRDFKGVEVSLAVTQSELILD